MLEEILKSAWYDGIEIVLVALAIFSVCMAIYRPKQRDRLFRDLRIFLMAECGLVICGILRSFVSLTRFAEVLGEVFIFVQGMMFIRIVGRFLFELLYTKYRLPRILEDIVIIVGYFVWALVRLRYAGADFTGIVTTSALITAVVAFSMQDTLGNILGGLALQIDNSINIGDWIKIDDVIGRVVDIGWRSTLVETNGWETVVIPNSALMKNRFRVLGRVEGEPVKWRCAVEFEGDGETQPDLVIQTVEDALGGANIEGLAKNPPLRCVMANFASGAGRYILQYWVSDIRNVELVESSVRRHLFAALQRAGIQLAAQSTTNMIVRQADEYDKSKDTKETSRRMDVLKKAELFQEFSDDELNTLAQHLVRAPYARGEIIIQQGSSPRFLFLLTKGDVETYLASPEGNRCTVSAFSPPDTFGEVGLMTGEPREINAIAKTNVECYRLDKAGFGDVLRARPELATKIAQRLEAQRALLANVRAKMGEAVATQHSESDHADMLAKVTRFFGLGHD